MKTFSDMAVFAAFLAARAAELPQAQTKALEAGAKLVQEDAKHRIGTYQAATGPFGAWDRLSSATLEGFHHPRAGRIPGKEELGYAPPDNPLLREGHLRDSIAVTARDQEAAVGSPEKIAIWQELGTPNAMYPIPPRSFLGAAGFAKAEAVANTIGKAVTKAIAGG